MSFADLIVDTVRDEFAGGLDAPTSEADLADLLRNYFGVVFPDTKICEHHSTPWRTFCDAYFARYPMIVVKGSRLFAGKSFWLATLGLTEAVTLGIDVDVLGGSGAQSKRVVDYMTKHWHSPGAPTDQLVNDPGTMETKLTGGNKVRALLASQRSVRGSHPTRLRLDEVDEMPLDIFDAAMGLTYGGSGVAAQTTIASTHHHADGTMAEILRRATDEGWEVREWCYRESLEPHGWLAHSEVLRKQGEMTSAQWAAEVELQEPEPEGRAIQTEKVEAMFDPGLGEYEGADGQEVIIAKPEKGAKYTTGVDWAKAVDYTTVVTFRSDVTPMQLVAFKRTRRRPWPELIDDVNRRTSQYGSTGCHDATGMDVAGDYLTGSLKGVSMVGKSRADMLSAYVRAVEHDEMRSPRIRSMYQEHRFARVVDLYTSRQSGHLPDTVAAAALAYYAVSSQHEFTEDHFMSPLGW